MSAADHRVHVDVFGEGSGLTLHYVPEATS